MCEGQLPVCAHAHGEPADLFAAIFFLQLQIQLMHLLKAFLDRSLIIRVGADAHQALDIDVRELLPACLDKRETVAGRDAGLVWLHGDVDLHQHRDDLVDLGRLLLDLLG